MITFDSEYPKFTLRHKKLFKLWIQKVAEFYNHATGDLGYLFCNDERILEVNREYLQHDYFTDIITFDYSEDGVISGDMYISIDTVKSNAELFGQSFERELHRVIIHGILHLCGFKDKEPDEEVKMRDAEERALALLDYLAESFEYKS